MNEFLAPHVVAAFASNVALIGQEKQSALLPYVNADLNTAEKGDRWTEDWFGRLDFKRMKSQWSNSPEQQIEQFRRFAFFHSDDCGAFTTKDKVLEQLVDPKSALVQAVAAAEQRYMEQSIFDDILYAETQYEVNEDEQIQTVSFPTGNIIAVDDPGIYYGKLDGRAAPTGNTLDFLNPAKLRKAKVILNRGEEQIMSMPIVPVEEEDVVNLLTAEELTDADKTAIRRLEDHNLTTWGGFQFVKVAPGRLRLAPGTNDVYETVVYLREYAGFKTRSLTDFRMVERADKNFQPYLYCAKQASGMRTRDSAFVRVRFQRHATA